MKVETLNEQNFTPIEIKITIESEEELCDLWHRMNLAPCKVREGSTDYLRHKASLEAITNLWEVLDYHVKGLNLR